MRQQPSTRACRQVISVAIATATLVTALLLLPSNASVEEGATSRFLKGLGAGICTLVYTPVKVAYAAASIPLGVLVFAWSAGDGEMAVRVIATATAGDYVVTPSHLSGDQDLVFGVPQY